MSATPTASVILPAYRSQRTVAASLHALERQTFQDFETIIVDSSPDEGTAEVVRRFPDVQLVLAGRRMLPHEARNVGAARAKGRILVFTDPDCAARPDWLERLVTCHNEGWKAVGGAVEPMPGLWNRALHWTRYGWWMTGGPASIRPEVPSANQSFSRQVWEDLGGYQSDRFASDSEICWRALARGTTIRFDPSAVVVHDHPFTFVGFVRDRWSRGRDFGRLRMETRGWGPLTAAARVLVAPVAPIVMTWRAAGFAAESGRLLEWAAFSPVQWFGHSIWCSGEAVETAARIAGSRWTR